MNLISIICTITLLAGLTSCVPLSPSSRLDETSFFMNHAELKEGGQYNLYWNFTDTDITFKAVVRTNGWLGFGLSPNGGMYNSDVLLAWFGDDGSENLVDAHVRPSGLHRPIADVHQNWQKLFMKQENGVLTVIFTRKIKVCGQADSGEINLEVTGTQPIIFAWGDGFENGKSFPTYHGNSNRGSKVLAILGSLNEQVDLDLDSLDHADFTIDYTLPEGMVTEYYCQMFKLPTSWTQTKKHVIRYDTLVSKENFKYLHHWLLYECDATFETEFIPKYGMPKPDSCLNSNNIWGPVQQYCRKISLAWAVGGNLEVVLPKEYGYPIGPGSFKYFFIQMHYENPGLDKNVHDKSGFRLYVTEEYRPIEFGILTIGSTSDARALIIPPKTKNLRVDNICRKEFMDPMLDDAGVDEITVFAELPHTHLAGTEMHSKILRNNKEVEHISHNPYYDSNFQYVNFMPKHVKIKRGDELISSCVYNTQDRDEYTVGGLGTYDEMCLNFIWYFPPAPNFEQCLEHNNVNDLVGFFSKLSDNGDFNWVINNEQTFFEDTLASLQASDRLRDDPDYTEKQFQEFYANSGKVQQAATGFGFFDVEFPHVDIERLVDDDSC